MDWFLSVLKTIWNFLLQLLPWRWEWDFNPLGWDLNPIKWEWSGVLNGGSALVALTYTALTCIMIGRGSWKGLKELVYGIDAGFDQEEAKRIGNKIDWRLAWAQRIVSLRLGLPLVVLNIYLMLYHLNHFTWRVYVQIGFIYLVVVIPLQRVWTIAVARQYSRRLVAEKLAKYQTFSVGSLRAVYRYFKRGTRRPAHTYRPEPVHTGRRLGGTLRWLNGVWKAIKEIGSSIAGMLRFRIFLLVMSKILISYVWQIAGAYSAFWLNEQAIKGVGNDHNHNPWWGPDSVSSKDETQTPDRARQEQIEQEVREFNARHAAGNSVN